MLELIFPSSFFVDNLSSLLCIEMNMHFPAWLLTASANAYLHNLAWHLFESDKPKTPFYRPRFYLQDMNMGSDEGAGGGRNTSPYRKYSGGRPGSARSPTRSHNDWRSYDDRDDSSPSIGATQRFEVDPSVPLEQMSVIGGGGGSGGDAADETESSDGGNRNKAVIIGDELLHADARMQDEMQRKKERIMMQSLRRKQRQEENRLRREEESRRRELEDKDREEERSRKKEEEKARRDAILEQHKMKKEMEREMEERVRKHFASVSRIVSFQVKWRSFRVACPSR